MPQLLAKVATLTDQNQSYLRKMQETELAIVDREKEILELKKR